MSKRGDIFKCQLCGAIVQVVNPGCVPVCCGQPMKAEIANTVDASKEKHVPVAENDGGLLKVKVGSAPHPMAADHFIEWIEIDAGDRVGKHFFQPGDAPEFTFRAPYAKGIVIRAYCNKHGLWEAVV